MLSDEVLDQAYQWVCQQRITRAHNNSIWDLRFNWAHEKSRLKLAIHKNTYYLSPMRRYVIKGESVSAWEAIDAVVLKAFAITLQPLFSNQSYPACTHLKSGGGIHGALRKVSLNKSQHHHLLKSDIYHYYESMNHGVLLDTLKKHVHCTRLLRLVTQYCERLEIRDGHYFHFTSGIPKGCPLSPLMAALYLKPLDEALSRLGCYIRYMDDWVLMVKTKHQLRKVVRVTHKILKSLKLKMHPAKTFIGRINKGFDFLGIHFSEIPSLSAVSYERHRTKVAQRYAQGVSNACIGAYLKRWTSWSVSVLKSCCIGTHLNQAPGAFGSRSKPPPDLIKEIVYEGCIKRV